MSTPPTRARHRNRQWRPMIFYTLDADNIYMIASDGSSAYQGTLTLQTPVAARLSSNSRPRPRFGRGFFLSLFTGSYRVTNFSTTYQKGIVSVRNVCFLFSRSQSYYQLYPFRIRIGRIRMATMKIGDWLKSEVEYGRDLADSGWQGARTACESMPAW